MSKIEKTIYKADIAVETEPRGHIAYKRTVKGKQQFIKQKGVKKPEVESKVIPQKGTVLKEREKEVIRAEDIIGGEEHERFKNLLNGYFYTQQEMKEMKNLLAQHETELEDIMGQIRPLLTKFDNMEKEEAKFRTEFKEGDWDYKFLSFTRESKPYKDLYIKAFNMLDNMQKNVMKETEEALKKITVSEKFEREKVAKAILDLAKAILKNEKSDKEKDVEKLEKKDNNIEDSQKALIESLTNLVALKERGLVLMKEFFERGKRKAKNEERTEETKKSIGIIKELIIEYYQDLKKAINRAVWKRDAHTIIIKCSPWASEEIVKLLDHLKIWGNLGHSGTIRVDPEYKEAKDFGFDGDGSSKIYSIEVEKPEKYLEKARTPGAKDIKPRKKRNLEQLAEKNAKSDIISMTEKEKGERHKGYKELFGILAKKK